MDNILHYESLYYRNHTSYGKSLFVLYLIEKPIETKLVMASRRPGISFGGRGLRSSAVFQRQKIAAAIASALLSFRLLPSPDSAWTPWH
jgi:hypothetical protein